MMNLPRDNSGGAPTGVTGPDGVTTSADLGSLPAGVVGFGLNQAGVPGPVAGLATAALQSDSFDALQDSVLSSLASTLGSVVTNAALPGIPGLPALGGALAGESVKDDSNLGAAAVNSVSTSAGALLAGTVAGPLGALVGGTLAGYAAKTSLNDGWLGDMVDSRMDESKRDAIEDSFGFNPNQTSSMAATQKGMDAFGVTDKGFGLDAAFGSTTAGQLSNSAKQSGLLDDSSLMGYLDALDQLAKEFEDVDTGVTRGRDSGVGQISGAGFSFGDSDASGGGNGGASSPGDGGVDGGGRDGDTGGMGGQGNGGNR